MDDEVAFQKLEHDSADTVLALHHNLYGNRMVTGSSDHHLRVWDKKGTDWILVDSWRAHDADITDVKWNAPFTGALIASISTDGLCKLWLESPTTAPRSGRRFTLIHTIPSKSLLPWQSLDFKALNHETYLALTTYDGNLSIFEPRYHDHLAGEWTDWFSSSSDFHVVDPIPQRSEETSFSLSWHQERLPCWPAVQAGLDKKSMGLAVAAMENVKVFRTDRERRFYLAAELTGARDIVRSVAWSNGAMRGFDVIATASKDGVVRVYELTTPLKRDAASNDYGVDVATPQRSHTARSGIGVGLAEMSRAGYLPGAEDHANDPSHVRQDVRLAAELKGHQGAVWRVSFSFTGDLLFSTGDDGAVRTWSRTVDGAWEEYAEVDIDLVEREEEMENEDGENEAED